MARVKVTINKKGYIPSLGQGPIRRPILINESLYKQLVALGYPVRVISSPIKPIIKKEEETPVVPPIVDDTIIEEEVTETSTEVVDEESPVVEEEVTEEKVVDETLEEETTESEDATEEVLEDDPDLSAEAFYTEEFLTSKNLCKKILSNRGIQYDKNASWGLLKQLVLESNPEIVEE